jgi:hypothetical protein
MAMYCVNFRNGENTLQSAEKIAASLLAEPVLAAGNSSAPSKPFFNYFTTDLFSISSVKGESHEIG